MALRLLLGERKSYPWFQRDHISFCGYFIYEGVLYSGDNAVSFLTEIEQCTADEKTRVISEFNGIFSFIIDAGDHVLLACDRLRGLPLFYCAPGDITVGDSAERVARECGLNQLNDAAVEEYRLTGLFVTGSETLICGLYQVQAAEIVTINHSDQKITRQEYFHYKNHASSDIDPEALRKEFEENYDKIADDLVLALAGRTAVVPLSGGGDSRMVVSMLHKKQYQKVICYTYGIKDNLESRISKEVAEHFGYPWHMVEYNPAMWSGFRRSNAISGLEEYAANLVSTIHVQDYMAVSKLIEKGIIPDDAVFIPGHSGDLIAGSHLTEDFLKKELSYDDFFRLMIDKFYSGQCTDSVKAKLDKRFYSIKKCSVEDYSREMEWFNTRERQAKFIVNSCRTYEYFGYEWLIPLWDNSQYEFWSKVPISLRYKKKFYLECTKDGIRSTNDRSIVTKAGDRARKIPVINNFLRRARRIGSYYRSKMGFERMFSFGEYMRACLTMRPTFTINDLLCKKQIDRLTDQFNR